MAFSTPFRRTIPLDAPNAYEQLQLLEPPIVDGGLTPLGIPGFAGFFLSLLEHAGWVVSITRGFAGDLDDVLVVAAKGDEHVQHQAQPAAAAVEVFRQARELERNRRQEALCQV